MKKPDLTKYKTTSTLYLLILIIAAVALVFGWQCTSYSLSNHSADLHIQMLPSRRVKVSKATTVYRISDVRWTKKASTLMFYSQHQTVVVEVDGKLLYTRSLKTDSILHTTGRNCEMVSVPENTRSILVTLTNCNLDKQVSDPVFYQGDGVHMFRHELLKAGIPMLLGIMNVVLGILMLIYWLFVHHWAYVSKSMLYLGILTTDLGAWFCLETSSSILLSQNPVFHSYVTRMLLLLLPIPFMMFVRHYLKARDRYLCRIFVWLDVAEIAVVLFLQLMDIRDLTQTLWMTHVMIGLAVLCFIFYLYHLQQILSPHDDTCPVDLYHRDHYSDRCSFFRHVQLLSGVAGHRNCRPHRHAAFYRNPCLRHRIRIPKGNRYRPSRGSLP